jgi:hypothetical protein
LKLKALIVALICIIAVQALSGCIGNKDESSGEKIVRPAGATDTDVIKKELKTLSNSDGPRGITLFFAKLDKEDGIIIDAKADESSDFVDTIAAIALLDSRLITQNVTAKKYTIRYSGVYMPNTGTFQITPAQLNHIAKDAKTNGLVKAAISLMSSGELGEQLEIHGKAAGSHYTPSSEKSDMYMGYKEAPDYRISLV